MSHGKGFKHDPREAAEGLYLFIYAPKLPGPCGVIQEGPQVKAVVIWTVVLGVVGGSESGHFMSVHGVHPEEMLDL